jgi:tight adherence protein B
MNWSLFPLLLAIFLFAASLTGGLFLAFTETRYAEKKLVRRRLLYMSAGGMHGKEKFSLYKQDAIGEAGFLGGLLYRLPRIPSLDRLLIRSRLPMNASTFVLLSLALGATGAFLGGLLPLQPPVGSVLGLLAGAVPYLLLRRAERTFVRVFEEQLPEVMDFIVRAMRSGHALTSAMEMASQELPDPVASELAATVDQVKFGLSTKDALENLCHRTRVADLRFFSITVVLQKESGGNITEVFSKISHMIRQRLQFGRQVRALTAEGKYSAVVLILLPPALFAYMYVVNFEYISLLWRDPAGRYMAGLGIVAQIFGYAIMRKMASLNM